MTSMRSILCVLVSTLVIISMVSAEERPTAGDEEHHAWQTLNACPADTVKAATQADWGKYVVFHLMPSEYRPGNSRHHLQPKQVQKMTSALDRDLKRVFGKTVDGEGATLDIRPVIKDVKKSNLVLNVLSFAAINTAVSYGRASVKYELIDDATGNLVGEVENRGAARPWNIYPWQILSDFEPLGHSYIMLNRGAKRMRKDLVKLQALKPTQEASLPVPAGIERRQQICARER